MNITELMRAARKLGRDQHAAGEDKKLGTLRAGSSGTLSAETGEIAGGCHRKSHIRSLGMEVETPTEDKLIMFELGYANEDVIFDQLVQVLPEGQILLREEEIPIEWSTTNGTRVTGRPDGVICEVGYVVIQEGIELKVTNKPWDILPYTGTPPSTEVRHKPLMGIELKSVHSLWTARDVLFGQKPKMDHLVQACHYMWKLGTNYKLVYKSYSQLGQGMAGNEWIIKQFPAPGEPGSEYVEYSYKTSRKTGQQVATIKHIKQFEIVYDLRLDENGRLEFCPEGSNDYYKTVVTVGDIERYYEYVSQMATSKDLGPRPSTIQLDGSKANYSNCNYCPLQAVCDSSEALGYEKWLEEVKKELRK